MTIKLTIITPLRNTPLQVSSGHGNLKAVSPSSKLNTAQRFRTTYVKSKDTKVFLKITMGEEPAEGCYH